MKEFTLAVDKIRPDLPAVISFAVTTFFMEFFSAGLLSFAVLREWKESFTLGRDPDVSRVIQTDEIAQDIKPWLYLSLINLFMRLGILIFCVPIYIVTQQLMLHLPLLGVLAWLFLIILGIFLLSVRSMFVHWYSLLYVDQYFTEVDSFKAGWAHLKRFSLPILQFSLLENILFFSSWLVPCLGPILLHRPITQYARLISYEEHRETLLHAAKEDGLQLVKH